MSRVFNSLWTSLEGQTIEWCTDNKNVKRIVEVGSRKPNLQQTAVSFKEACNKYCTSIHVKWIPQEQNVHAEFLSKCNDSDDWQIRPE